MLSSTLKQALIILFLLTGFFISNNVSGQYLGKKNTIKLNLTSPVIFGSKALILGYERVIGKKQSFCISVGAMSLREFLRGQENDSIRLNGNSKPKGFNISGEYRFYLSKENKFEAPRGVYVGPYYAYNYMGRTNTWDLNTSTFKGQVSTDLSLKVHTIGAELGYQFVIWKKLAIDLVLAGPGVGFYSVNAKINSNFDQQTQELFFEKLNDYLGEKIPGYDLVINADEMKKTGNFKTTALGFRYVANIGFRF